MIGGMGMTNEEFQKIVLEELKGLREDVAGLKEGQSNLEEGQLKLEQGQSNLEEGQLKLEQGQSNLEEGQLKLEQRQSNLEEGQLKLEQGQEEIKRELRAVVEQTADLTEFREEINAKVDKIIEELNTIEIVTSKNWNDIARLKSVK